MSDKYSRLFASYAHNVKWEDLPPETIHEVKRRILDSIGVAIAAFRDDAPMAARKYASDYSVPDGAAIWGLSTQATPEASAFANGVMVRYLDFNDTYLSLEPIHPSDVIPGLMALCQWGKRSIKDLVASIALAYEVMVDLCDAASLREHQWDHVVYTGLGAACGAARLIDLTPPEIEHAISIYSVPHASMRQTRAGELSMWKGAAAANSVRNAVFASLAARSGFTGPYSPFEGEMGFFSQLFNGGAFDDAALRSVEEGSPPALIRDTYIKKWPVEYHAQSAVDAAIDLRDGLNGKLDSIESIKIDTFKVAYEIIAKDPEKWRPKTRETADHSLPYIICAALQDGTITKESFSQAKIQDSDIRALLDRTTLEEDSQLTLGYPEGIPNRITISRGDGGQMTKEVSFPRGHAKNKMTDNEVIEKFRVNVSPYWTQEQTDRAVDLVMCLEEQQDLESLMETLEV